MEPKKILLVEDEPQMRKMTALELVAAGYLVLEAEDGEQGLQMAKEHLPNLIISDVLMPKMDGFTFYKELKKDKRTADIPVLILTARGKMEDSFRVVGADDFIPKPFVSDEFLKKVEGLLSQGKSSETIKSTKRILLAGDDNATLENMSMQLRNAGCHTDFVTSGAQVISKAVMFLPQVLIMDVLMNGIDSPQIIKILRVMPQAEKIPIIVYNFYRLENLGNEDVRQRALSVDAAVEACQEAGANEYLGRFNETAFLQRVKKYLK